MPRRLLALVAAVAMVAGAFAVRGWLDRRSEDKANPPGLACIPELIDFCQLVAQRAGVGVTMEAAGQTAARMTALNGAGNIDGWLTLADWPAMADARRELRGLPRLFTSGDNPVLARSPIVLAVWPDRAAALRTACQVPQVDWKCLGTAAQKRLWKDVAPTNPAAQAWGPVKLGLPDAADGALGLAIFAVATTNYFGRADVSTADFEDDGYRTWAHALADATPSRFPDVAAFLVQGAAIEDVYAGTEAQIVKPVAASARADKPELIYPSPVATADLVLAVAPGRAGERLRDVIDDLADELFKLGWKRPGDPSLPADDGLPDAGVLDALRQVWKEAA